MTDFKRGRRKSEGNQLIVGGLPLGDKRRTNKKAYGEIDGAFVGFMDDLTPCRVKRSVPAKPWFRLNSQFMDVKKNRCFSGPPTHWGYCAEDLTSAQPLFFWYALARTFLQQPYPLWVNADDMWGPSIPQRLEHEVFSTAFAIGYAENECVETYFPANNPVPGTREIFVPNPMTPLNPSSFWRTTQRPYIGERASPEVQALITAVDALFEAWNAHFGARNELSIAYKPPYFVDARPLTRTAGIQQIKDYAKNNDEKSLRLPLERVKAALRAAKDEFYSLVTAADRINYFGRAVERPAEIAVPDKTRFDKILCKRLALAGLLVRELHTDPNFGRTKLAKLFYLADVQEELGLDTEYAREAAGPLDQRALYNKQIGIEALAQKHRLFQPEAHNKMIRYHPLDALRFVEDFSIKHLGSKVQKIKGIASSFSGLTTEQSEVIATLFACWNDFLIRKRSPTDDEIITELLLHWHPKKGRFSRPRLARALGVDATARLRAEGAREANDGQG